MTRTRFHHLSVCLLCFILLFRTADAYAFLSADWWLTVAAASYAMQPVYNESRRLVGKRPRRARVDLYELVGK